jgi:hypothetical protein
MKPEHPGKVADFFPEGMPAMELRWWTVPDIIG